MRLAILFVALALFLAAPARAEWYEASGEHFVVYANDSARDIERFASQLERFHAGIELVTGIRMAKPSPSNRVTVYVVRSEAEVRRLYGNKAAKVGGFYIPRAGGSLAIVPQVNSGSRDLDQSMLVLLHEYTHHFAYATSQSTLPRWVAEGSAEFFASARFEPDGTMWLGRPAHHRAAELFHLRDIKVRDIVDPDTYLKRKERSFDSFYGKSWLLYHYLVFAGSRSGQIDAYAKAMARGLSSPDAAQEAFGDLDVLESEVDSYLQKSRVQAFKIPPSMLQPASPTLRRLRDGEIAIMPVRVRSRLGVDTEEAARLVVEARAVAARHGNDPAVLAALAEAEFDAGNDAAAIVAADAALALDPATVDAHVQKSYALYRMAAEAEDEVAAYRRAREAFVRLNRLENDHPVPLYYFFQTYVASGQPVPPLAVDGLRQAIGLAPFDKSMRMTLASHLIGQQAFDEARRMLGPVAFDPHGGGYARAARRLIDKMDADPEWDGRDIGSVMAEEETGEVQSAS